MAGGEDKIVDYIKNDFEDSMKNNKLKKEYHRLSDIINAVTDGKINLGSSHKKNYWNSKTKKAEIWAECGTIYYNNNQDEIVMLRELFPNVENEFIKIIDKIK